MRRVKQQPSTKNGRPAQLKFRTGSWRFLITGDYEFDSLGCPVEVPLPAVPPVTRLLEAAEGYPKHKRQVGPRTAAAEAEIKPEHKQLSWPSQLPHHGHPQTGFCGASAG